jgi:hypothetical protein
MTQRSILIWRHEENPMSRILVALLLLLNGVIAASGLGLLCCPEATPFIVAGATDVQVISVGWGRRQIKYRAPGPPDQWYFTLTRTLEAQGWTPDNRWRPDASSIYDPVVALSFKRKYPGLVVDEVVLLPDRRDPQRVTITMHRHITFEKLNIIGVATTVVRGTTGQAEIRRR